MEMATLSFSPWKLISKLFHYSWVNCFWHSASEMLLVLLLLVSLYQPADEQSLLPWDFFWHFIFSPKTIVSIQLLCFAPGFTVHWVGKGCLLAPYIFLVLPFPLFPSLVTLTFSIISAWSGPHFQRQSWFCSVSSVRKLHRGCICTWIWGLSCAGTEDCPLKFGSWSSNFHRDPFFPPFFSPLFFVFLSTHIPVPLVSRSIFSWPFPFFHFLMSSPWLCRKNHRVAWGVYPLYCIPCTVGCLPQ